MPSDVFPDSDEEWERLVSLANAYDPRSRWLIERLVGEHFPDGPPSRMLDAGAGSGSMALWFQERFSADVTALDRNVKRLAARETSGLTLVEVDVCEFRSSRKFDIVYSRFLLDLVRDVTTALRVLQDCTSAGGWLVIEEFDDLNFEVSFGSPIANDLHQKVVLAKQAAWRERDHPNHFGRHVFELLRTQGVARLEASLSGAVRQGGTDGTRTWRQTVSNLSNDLLATEMVTQDQLQSYLELLGTDESFHFFSPTVVTVLAQV